ncbi:hypothetical protein [Escherichia coli]|uniref:hypothetical protein n=1 Tax=Escherichia coli TaxID=562 RepID=UPI002FCCC380
MTLINTQTGELSDGVVFNGTVHKNFELRLPVMRDNGRHWKKRKNAFRRWMASRRIITTAVR